jgi:hypothetical protein
MTMGMVAVARLAASAGPLGRGDDHVHFLLYEIGGQLGVPLGAALGPAIGKDDVLALDMTTLSHAVGQGGDDM